MTDSPTQQEVSLPNSVEHLINKICEEQSQPPPDHQVRRKLASVGEEVALDILRFIATKKIEQTFSGFIIRMVNNHNNNNSSSIYGSPLKRVRLYPPQQNRSPVTTVPQGTHEALNNSTATTRTSIPQYVALGKLDFRKAFVILSYIGKKSLEEVTTADEIQRLKDLRMDQFEAEVWKAFGEKYTKPEDRQKLLDWDSGKTLIYHCHVFPDGSYTFQGPFLTHTKTHLQRELGDDNVLMVKFAEEVTDQRSSDYAKYSKIAREGILVGLRRYHFFVFKDGGKEEKRKDPTSSSVKCYFVRIESDASIDMGQHYILSGKRIHEARSMFMHVRTVSSVANYMSRLSLILSKTKKLEVDLANVNIERIDDIPCRDSNGNIVYRDGKPLIHTDGTGFISEDLALKCPKNVFKGKCSNDDNIERVIERTEPGEKSSDMNPESHSEEPPLLIQVRLFNKGTAVKGTLLVNKKLSRQTIQIRPSMIKVEPDPGLSDIETCNSLEVVKTSNQPRKTHLSRYLIALLRYGGVPENFFEDLLRNALEDAQDIFTKKRNSLKVSLNYGGMDDFIATRMILSGIPLDESYLQYCLSILMNILMNKEKENLQRGKLPVPESYYLMGTVDPTGTLKSDEVCIVLNDGQVSCEKVLVYRNPGLHFGDVHVLKATHVKELEDFIGNSKYAIFFPTKGPRSLADEIAGGDFDGDMYFVSRNPELLKHFKESERWKPTSATSNVSNKRPSDFSPEELEDELFKLFLTTRFQPSYAAGVAADSWLARMDQLLTLGDESANEKILMKKNLLQLIDIYYDALDAPKKSGRKIEVPKELKAEMFPIYMGKDESISFDSKSVLGKIYHTVKSYEAEDLPVKVWKLPCFDVGVPEPCKTKWKVLYGQYRQEMRAALCSDKEDKNEAADEVIKNYKQILYGAEEFEQSTRSLEEIYDEALAIYHITYDFAKNKEAVGYCDFAWKVAGSALCKLYALKQSERTMCSLPEIRKSIFRRPQGLYISLKEKGKILEVLRNWPERSIQVIVVADGDGNSVGKLAPYTALGGIRPSACLLITIDLARGL
ncbi:hypothetical protein LWI29_032755 [Acer saccharum]|uniref:RNA-dependent RNA polymerase n=1 Tax=Acer saccharum TaxID=4024 RepID=A0AA39RFT1_ACESA|nr:hypothetical protein LWI29_032755 [Acer saccharum]